MRYHRAPAKEKKFCRVKSSFPLTTGLSEVLCFGDHRYPHGAQGKYLCTYGNPHGAQGFPLGARGNPQCTQARSQGDNDFPQCTCFRYRGDGDNPLGDKGWYLCTCYKYTGTKGCPRFFGHKKTGSKICPRFFILSTASPVKVLALSGQCS